MNVCRTAAALAPCLHMIIICPFSAYMLIPVRGSSPQGQEAPLRSFPKLFTYCQKYSTNALHIPYLPLLRVPLLSTLRNVLLGHLSSLSPSLPLSLSLSLSLYLSICAHACKCCEGAVNSKEQMSLAPSPLALPTVAPCTPTFPTFFCMGLGAKGVLLVLGGYLNILITVSSSL